MVKNSLGRHWRTLGTRAPPELTSSVNVVSTFEAESCPDIWTATVIGILFSIRSVTNACGIDSLSNSQASASRVPACSPLQTGRDAGQRPNTVRTAFHPVQG